MSKKKVFMLRLNPDLYAALEKWAADEFRSVNGQIEWLLDRTLTERGRIAGADSKSANAPKTGKK